MTNDTPKHAFRDLAGRVWLLVLNYGLARRIHESFPGVDFANAHNGQCFQKLAENDETFVGVLFAIVEKQSTEAGVSPEQFAEALSGEQLEAAGEALAEAVTLFTRPAVRPVLAEMVAQGKEGQAAAVALTVDKLHGPRTKAAIDRALTRLGDQIDQALDTISPPTGTS